MKKHEHSSRIFGHLPMIPMAAAVLCAAVMCGCDNDSEPIYTVISNGTESAADTSAPSESSSSETDIYAAVSDTELYIPEHMVTKYASLSYNTRMQDAYNDVVDTIAHFRTTSLAPLTLSTEDYRRVLETVRCEQMMFFHVQSRFAGDFDPDASTYEMNFEYKYSVREANIMLMESEAAAKAIVAQTDDSMSDYEKLKFFHDYLALTVESDTESPYSDSIYGALVEKKALCEGFAKAYSYLCNLAGIENMIVTGKTDVDHMWNMVKLDGKWYHVDVGWDQPADSLRKMYPDMVLYQYFLAEDSVVKNNRTISDLMCVPPEADSTEYSYFNFEGLYAASYEEALEIIKQACGKCIDSGEKYFMLKLDSSNLYLKTTSELGKRDESGVSDIDRLMEELNFRGKISYIDYYKAYRIIIFVLE